MGKEKETEKVIEGTTNTIWCGDIKVSSSDNSVEELLQLIKTALMDEHISTYLNGIKSDRTRLTGRGFD